MKSVSSNILNWKIFSNLPINCGITNRNGGFSNGQYSSFNLATHTGDNPDIVDKNRRLLCSLLNVDFDKYIYATQVHGSKIAKVNNDNYLNNFECDGFITNEAGLLLNIYVADCVPIIIYDKENNVGAVLHCGWKGTFEKIIYNAVQILKKDYNSDSTNLLMGIGPSIGECCYNVSEELYKNFNPLTGEGHVKNNKYYLNLKEINKNQAISVGILEENIEIMDICTYCDNKNFYSHRKEGEPTGRFSLFFSITS
ncbi:MAG: peptidoglycan editing factor PgeF [Spirochaetales bacterium]|nr:peptidoglycan editing factor PgeF [Spirochaetales bacterium]